MTEDFFEGLCNKYYKKILKYSVLCVKDKDIADDIVQEVFIVVYKKLDLLKSHPNIGGFIYQTAKNIINEHKRRLYTTLMHEIREDREFMGSGSVEKEIDSRIDEYEYITDIISQLSDEKYRLYKLYYIDNMPMDKIADKLGIEYTALRMRYVRLRREIKEMVRRLAEEKF